MKLSGIQIMEGEMAPWWYGVAYYPPCSDYIIFCPVPINLLVRFVRTAWWEFHRGKTRIYKSD